MGRQLTWESWLFTAWNQWWSADHDHRWNYKSLKTYGERNKG